MKDNLVKEQQREIERERNSVIRVRVVFDIALDLGDGFEIRPRIERCRDADLGRNTNKASEPQR